MKKIIISLLLLIPILTGCTNINTKLTINKDETASIETGVTYKGDLSKEKSYNAMTILENYSKFLDKNYVVYPEFEDNSSSIYARKKVKNIRYTDLDLSSLGFSSNLPDGKFVEVKKNLFVKLYNIDMSYDYNKAQDKVKVIDEKEFKETVGGLKPEYYFKYFDEESFVGAKEKDPQRDDFLSNMDESIFILQEDTKEEDQTNETESDVNLTFSIKLPSFAAYNNADIALAPDTYLWKIKKDGVTNIKLQYIVYNGVSFTFLILLFILILVYVAKRILRHDSQKRIGSEN